MKALTACCNVYKAFMCAIGCGSTTISVSRGMPVIGHIDTHNIAILQMASGNYFDIYRNDGAVSCRFSLASTANPGTYDMEFFGYYR